MSQTGRLLVSGSFLRVFTLVVNVVIAFFLMPFIIHAIGDRWYGLWILVGTFMGYFGLLDFGLSAATQRYINRSLATNDKQGVNVALSTAIAVFMVLSCVSIILTALVIYYGKGLLDNPEDIPIYETVLILMGAKVAIAFPFYAFSGMLAAKLRFDIASYIQLFKLILRTILMVAFILEGYSIIALAAITLLTETIGYFLICYFALRLYPDVEIKKRHIKLKKLKEFYHYSKYIFITSVANTLRFSVDSMVIAKYMSLSMVTHYIVAARLIEYFGQFMMSLLSVAMPVFTSDHAKGNMESLRQKFLVVTSISAFVGIFLGGAIIVAGHDFILLWMGEDYLDAYIPLVILCVGSIVALTQAPSVSVLNAIAKHKYYAGITILEAVINLILSIILIQYFGLIGVALGTTLPILVTKLYFQPRYTCKQINQPMNEYISIIRKQLVFGIPLHGLFFLVLNELNPQSMLALLFYSGIYSIIYILINIKWILEAETKKHIESALPKKLKSVFSLMV